MPLPPDRHTDWTNLYCAVRLNEHAVAIGRRDAPHSALMVHPCVQVLPHGAP